MTNNNSVSPVDIFVDGMRIGFKAEASAAVRRALKDSDPSKLQAFTASLKKQLLNSTIDTGRAIVNALCSTEGPDDVANRMFARQIKSVFQAIDTSQSDFGLGPGIAADRRGLIESIVHRKDSDILQAIDGYINPLGPTTGPGMLNGRRRQFDKGQLLRTAQHVFMGTASAEEIREAQRALKAKGFNLGKSGQNHDGVDGVAGKFTVKAITHAIKPHLG